MANERRTPVEHGLAWDFRASFRHYLRYVAGGREIYSGGAAELADGRLYFPFLGAGNAPVAATRTLRFLGDLMFHGHAGVIQVHLNSPELELQAEGGLLRIEGAEGRLVLARLVLDDAYRVEDAKTDVYAYSTSLEAGKEYVFDGVYKAGEDLGALEIRVPSR